ncbi:Lrp/AsnC family transcriptional regulator [Hyphococcus flavus]|uniref:Lrp/AsnC family transcriptional regulator n=1 Tax=Hyphococcus flavus TaxID=1866326 RepID=A0AAF0CBB8_9PROT|nr:Lrp/AsnC family transcriptional regulator [Hyphococcus flavus]WDI30565.1 Lrp/AsnC family transcriptional regulator [Hyphococcus flavus]
MTKKDDIDDRILRILEGDGRISNADLAKAVNLSASACLRRVQELERTGVISGYRAVLNRDAMGVGLIAYVTVGLYEHTKKTQAEFERAMRAAPQVRECHNVTGAVEYLLRVEAADLPSYKHFHTEILGMTPKVQSITSYIVMETTKDERS